VQTEARTACTTCSTICHNERGKALQTVRKANQPYHTLRSFSFLPDLIKGDLDSLRKDVKQYYLSLGVNVVRDGDEYSTDLGKCIKSLSEKERAEGIQYDILILGGLAGRLDQTVHTLSAVHKLRKVRERVFVISDENVAWVLDEGEHHIHIDHKAFGQTCGLLPLGIDHTTLTTQGLEWNLTDAKSEFDGLLSTSNHLLPDEPIVYVKTTEPIWWTMEIRHSSLV